MTSEKPLPYAQPAEPRSESVAGTKLLIRDGDGEYRKASREEVIEAARGVISSHFRRGTSPLSSPSKVRDYLQTQIAMLEYEIFGVLLLDARHRLIRRLDMFSGTIDAATVHPREVIKAVLSHNASYVVCYHNHPSGESEPSQADRAITQRLKEALGLIDVRLLDHLIVGATVYSFAEAGWL